MSIATDNYSDIMSYLPLVDLWNCLFVSAEFNRISKAILNQIFVKVRLENSTVIWSNIIRDYPLVRVKKLSNKLSWIPNVRQLGLIGSYKMQKHVINKYGILVDNYKTITTRNIVFSDTGEQRFIVESYSYGGESFVLDGKGDMTTVDTTHDMIVDSIQSVSTNIQVRKIYYGNFIKWLDLDTRLTYMCHFNKKKLYVDTDRHVKQIDIDGLCVTKAVNDKHSIAHMNDLIDSEQFWFKECAEDENKSLYSFIGKFCIEDRSKRSCRPRYFEVLCTKHYTSDYYNN